MLKVVGCPHLKAGSGEETSRQIMQSTVSKQRSISRYFQAFNSKLNLDGSFAVCIALYYPYTRC